jgi:hypothetical protein
MYKIILKNEQLFAVSRVGACQQFEGRIVNTISGECIDNPDPESADVFAAVFSGHGEVFHLSDNSPNPFYIRARQLFINPEMLPENSQHVFLDVSEPAFNDFEAILIAMQNNA